ncbi:kinase-like domain-containing protein [Mycena albidolilacea]|uniref:Kinase-like domain-containing protein n=1 Tax=Mycena albidolilacea TaxID=1033008 RepID=A0AAD6ZM08_9AGAR|nr:kinase-like domain-containing protein [Mycena albidolilacea]
MKRDICAIVVELALLLQDPESYKTFLAYRGPGAQGLLDILQDVLDLDAFAVVKPLICKALLRLCRASGLYPRCFVLTELEKIGDQVAAGGFGDIWKGVIHKRSVCVKVMRLFKDSDIQALLKEFGREALIWRQFCHPNLLPFFGVYYLGNRLCLVSPWMENGTITEFLRDEPDADRLSLILDVALGLQYLHEQNVVHGDLKAINILVTPSQRACIGDFGLASIINTMSVRFTHSTGNVRGGTARYQAPELFKGIPSHFGSDVYAFACTCYEILTGRVPFHELPNDVTVMFKVIEGNRPSRPEACSGTAALDSLWKLLETCWDGEAEKRPNAAQIVKRLEGLSLRGSTAASATDWDEKFTSKFRRSLHDKPLLPSVAQIERLIFGDGESSV